MNIETSDHGEGPVKPAAFPPASVRVFGKKIMVIMPWSKTVNPITTYSVAQLIDRRRTASMLNYGDAFVAHSRNSCADYFLKSDLEWSFWVDDDMLLPFGDATWFKAYSGFHWLPEPFASFNAIDRLMSHGKTLVGALYFGRHPAAKAVYGEGASIPAETKYASNAPYDLIKPTRWVGTGALLVHRSVFEDMEKKFPRLARSGPDKMRGQWFTSSEHKLLAGVDKVRAMLAAGPMTGEKALKAYEMLEVLNKETGASSPIAIGEDVTFCLRAAECGHQPYVDMGLIAGHVGHMCYGPRNTGKSNESTSSNK